MSLPHSSVTAQHRKKRQFQPSITSYFHTDNNASDADDDDEAEDDYQRGRPRLRHIPRPAPHHPTLAPQVPDQVQSSLLSVGMRVRKSVPEGYKTPKTLHTTTTATYSQTPLRKPHAAFSTPALEPLKIPVDTLASTLQHQRELLPFCGLNKIGGYAEQPTANPPLLDGVTNSFLLPAQAFSQPFSSQDSGYGTDLERAKRGKRGWADDDGAPSVSLGATNFFFSIPAKLTGEEDVPVSPLSASPPPPTRPYAQPKSRRQARSIPGHVHANVDVDMEYESHAMHEGRLAAGHASDFEEADFLDGHEIAMGGV